MWLSSTPRPTRTSRACTRGRNRRRGCTHRSFGYALVSEGSYCPPGFKASEEPAFDVAPHGFANPNTSRVLRCLGQRWFRSAIHEARVYHAVRQGKSSQIFQQEPHKGIVQCRYIARSHLYLQTRQVTVLFAMVQGSCTLLRDTLDSTTNSNQPGNAGTSMSVGLFCCPPWLGSDSSRRCPPWDREYAIVP